MRVFALIALLSAAFAPGPAAAHASADPVRLVKSFYARDYDEEKMPLSAALKKLHASVVALSKKRDEPLAGLNFVWTLGAQDAEEGWEKTLAFKEFNPAPGRATIQATFRNGDPQEIRYHMIREKGRWAVDDIEYLTQREDDFIGAVQARPEGGKLIPMAGEGRVSNPDEGGRTT